MTTPYAPKKKRKGCHPDSWVTPPIERDFVREVYGGDPDLDVAATPTTAFGPKHYSRRTSGLRHRWHGRTWLQPPYSTIPEWVTRARTLTEIHDNKRLIVLALLPVRTGRRWWVECEQAHALFFVPSRIRFWDPVRKCLGTSPTFDSVYVLWDPFALVLAQFQRAVHKRTGSSCAVWRPERLKP